MLLWARHEAAWTLGRVDELPDRPALLDALRRRTRSSGDAVVWERWTFSARIALSERDGKVVASSRIETSNPVAFAALAMAVLAFLAFCQECAASPFAVLALVSLTLAPAALAHAIVSTWLLGRRVRTTPIPGARVVR